MTKTIPIPAFATILKPRVGIRTAKEFAHFHCHSRVIDEASRAKGTNISDFSIAAKLREPTEGTPDDVDVVLLDVDVIFEPVEVVVLVGESGFEVDMLVVLELLVLDEEVEDPVVLAAMPS